MLVFNSKFNIERFGDHLHQVRGVSYKKDQVTNVPIDDYIPILRAGNINDGEIIWENLVYVSRKIVSPKQLLKSGDIVIAASSGSIDVVGKAAIIRKDINASFGAFCKVIRPKNTLFPNYANYFFKTSNYRAIISHLASGININNLRNEHIDDLKIPLPSLAEQKRIAAILDKADEIRKKREESLRLADEFLKSTFLDMFGDPVKNPKRWEKQPLLDVLSFTTGKLDSNAAEINGKYPFFTCSQETFKINSYEFDCEALLLAGNNAAGVYSIKHYKGKFNAYQRTYVITIKNPTHSYEYYKTLIEFKLKELQRNSKGTNTKYLTMGIFERMYIPVPSESLQKQYSSIVKKLELQKEFLDESQVMGNNIFNSLIRRAFRGDL